MDLKSEIKHIDDSPNKILVNPIDSLVIVLFKSGCLRVYDIDHEKALGKINIPGKIMNCVGFAFNYQGLVATSSSDELFVIDIQSYRPLSVMFTQVISTFIPPNQSFTFIDFYPIDNFASCSLICFSDGTTSVIGFKKDNNEIKSNLVDSFNMFEYHIQKSEDPEIAKLYKNLTTVRVNS